ncbi:hypothetical protein Pcinc_002445 [Petrolisthes cinctipes]|uniref:Ketohexokinase n=1 Tax=Petrolisthes cinctipes TaxID=88211 RepID=A0AAE1GKX7_PETCI|nr:hypothetical protein Pcinc_002445 [Petrolisthes cinctipes]
MSEQLDILCVGLSCLDIINEVSYYPEEDMDCRCVAQWWQRGGNAANNCTVLGLLGARPAYLGTIADSHEKRFLLDDFAKYGVNTDHLVEVGGCSCPTSCVILSQTTGSRTIIHANAGLPELSVDDFSKVDLTVFDWIHFEGRNVANVVKMIEVVRKHNQKHQDSKSITISVEVEKAKAELDALIPLPDVLFVSKDYAKFKGFSNMAETVEKIQTQAYPGCLVICPWGEAGASMGREGSELVKSPAFPPTKVVDTLGAGDTFNAATIFALSRGYSHSSSITFACRLAGAKVGVQGWEAFRQILCDSNLGTPLTSSTSELMGRGS